MSCSADLVSVPLFGVISEIDCFFKRIPSEDYEFPSPYLVLSLKLQLIIKAPLVGELAPLAPEGFAPYCIFSIRSSKY